MAFSVLGLLLLLFGHLGSSSEPYDGPNAKRAPVHYNIDVNHNFNNHTLFYR